LALLAGKPHAALADAHTAAASDPVSTDPLWELSAIYSALGNVDAAHGELVKATELQPSNPATWEQLGSFDLQHDRASEAVGALLTAHRLDLGSPVATRLLVRARAQVAHG
jgi:cytochrome c-type biogenesis protein CcmH/NrfG